MDEPDRRIHETPALTARPMVTLRPAPGVTMRFPARAVTIVGVGVLLWCVLVVVTPVPWIPTALVVIGPCAALAALAETNVRGRSLPALIWIQVVHRRRMQVVLRRRREG